MMKNDQLILVMYLKKTYSFYKKIAKIIIQI